MYRLYILATHTSSLCVQKMEAVGMFCRPRLGLRTAHVYCVLLPLPPPPPPLSLLLNSGLHSLPLVVMSQSPKAEPIHTDEPAPLLSAEDLQACGYQLGFGTVCGYASGFAMKKFGAFVAFTVGSGFIALQSLQYMGYLNVNWRKVLCHLPQRFLFWCSECPVPDAHSCQSSCSSRSAQAIAPWGPARAFAVALALACACQTGRDEGCQ